MFWGGGVEGWRGGVGWVLGLVWSRVLVSVCNGSMGRWGLRVASVCWLVKEQVPDQGALGVQQLYRLSTRRAVQGGDAGDVGF